jgi:N-acyl-D-aspartate/D-glutamate deacylase
MRTISAIVLTLLASLPLIAEDLVLINGSVIDGTGKPRALANVRIRDGKVREIGPFKPASNETTIDVKGMIVAPGFIDFQTLSPSAVEKDPAAAAGALISQGVTTAILGFDGTGPYSVEDFMLPFDEKQPPINIGMLVGHARIRNQILGPDYKRAATPDELERMGELVSDAMKQGAFGFASDLQQEPASFSTADELLSLAKVVSKFGGTVLLTPRDAKSAVALARDAKVAVQVLTKDKNVLAEIDRARAQRIDISADAYSYAQLVQDKTVTLERGIQRMSSTPANRFGLRERGVLKSGAPGDLVVLNPMSLGSGPKYLFVNGTIALKDGQPTDARTGQALR